MAWSYRNDRSDEVYSSATGPGMVEAETLPRPPLDGEDAGAVMNPEEDETQKANVEAAKVKPKDPEAGPPPRPSLEGVPPNVIQEKKLGPAPPPTAEEQQKAIDAARGSSEKKPETKEPAKK